jgi:hypothetical protein
VESLLFRRKDEISFAITTLQGLIGETVAIVVVDNSVVQTGSALLVSAVCYVIGDYRLGIGTWGGRTITITHFTIGCWLLTKLCDRNKFY